MASGSFNLTSSNTRVSIWCNWYEQNTSITNNTSEVVVTVYLRRENNGYTTSGTMNTTVSLAGASQTESGLKFSNSGTADTLLFAKVFTVSHNSDGTKSITISISCDSVAVTGSGSQTVSLSTIARKSQISLSSTSFNVGDSVTMYTNRKSGNFTHSLYIKYANGYYNNPVATGIGDSYNINNSTINNIIYSQCPNAKEYSSTFLLRTFNGSTELGDTTVNFTAKIPDNSTNKPTFSGNTYLQTNEATAGLVGNNTGVVQGKSSLNVTFNNTSAKNSATIKTYGVTCGNKTYTSSNNVVTVDNVTKQTLTCWIEDSREFKSVENNITISEFYEYFTPLLMNKRVVRDEMVADSASTKATLGFTLKTPQIMIDRQSISIKYRYRKSEETTFGDYILITSPSSEQQNYSILLEQDFENDSSYIIEISATDAYGTYVLDELLLQTAKPELSIRKDRVGVNCVPTEDNGSFQIDGINFIDYIHPVNSIYLSVSPQNPSQIFPDTTWVSIAAGKALFGANDSIAIYRGGYTSNRSSHSHGNGTYCAAIGSCDSMPNSLGFIASNTLDVTENGSATYRVNGSSYKNGGVFNHYTKVYGTSGSASHLPPYMCVYIWKRVA